ncbi:MAG TPA: immunoglobulin domain-containing protein [Pirellulales bacterium]|nr:immunoglobulin domain-containing protein [Pirellulales bacterium]
MYVVIFALFAAKCHAQIGTPPVIAVQPLGLAVQNGGTAILATTAVSLTSMKFYWLFNDQPILTNNTTVVNVNVPLVGTVSTLTVKGVSPSNAGNYSVRIVNGVGPVTSSNAMLIVLTSAVSNVVNIVSTSTQMTASGFKLLLSGPPGSNYIIQASTDLKNWTSISTNAAPTGSVSYTDTAAINLPFRYYRAKMQ